MTEVRRKRLMRLKSCRLFNSAYLFKKKKKKEKMMWWETGTFSFFFSLFYPYFQQRGLSTLYILCCERGMCCFFFPLVACMCIYTYIYVENIYTHTYSIYNIWGDILWKINHEHSWCICKTTMYVQYACKCCCPGVARVHLPLSALSFLPT